ncbi:MAG TPA: amidohydrolase family protein [Acidobacteriota bacterium]|nr:amidohydrolase family protein [Acidobacteriota bacterium]
MAGFGTLLWMSWSRVAVTFVLTVLLWPSLGAQPVSPSQQDRAQPAYDWLFLGGRVLDGSGNPWFLADLAVKDGRIAAIGDLGQARASRKVEMNGRFIVPGFIDLHSHADDSLRSSRGLRSSDPQRRAAPNLVSQGITTAVVNQDGRSPWPIAEQKSELIELGIGLNAVLLAGHGTLRGQVMGADFKRPARPDEVQQMRELLRQALAQGAWGVSAGLEYEPGRWSTTDELVELMKEVAAAGGVYISHQRSEGADPMWFWPSRSQNRPPSLLDAVRETIEIGERSGATVVASHIKAKGEHYWGASQAAIELIERARQRGVEVWADQYPYDTTGSDGSTVLIPRWVWRPASPGQETEEDDGEDAPPEAYGQALRSVLADPEAAPLLRRDVAHEIARRGGPDKIVVFDHPDPAMIGRTLSELAASHGISPVEMAFKLQLEGYGNRPGGARLRGFSLAESDIRRYARRPWTATASDAGIALPEDGAVHARYYGTFPRKLRRYAIERSVLSLADAVRSSTSLPARILRLSDRGLLQAGLAADLVVIDIDDLQDQATFFKPHQHASGVDFVLVNGRAVLDQGRLTGELAGRVLLPHRR